ncbi:MAG: CopG family transcriptional regulator [Fischerella sp.]|nr:CopG family transcriptional regulator [Fischerella sp.]
MNKKWTTKRMTINLASAEVEKLEKYCNQTGRPTTDVIRELIRGLPVTSPEASAGNGLSLKLGKFENYFPSDVEN